MAIAHETLPRILPVATSSLPISSERMLLFIECKCRTVIINPDFLTVEGDARALWCSTSKFKEAYPEKWQEIQAELALQKLKDT